MQIIENKQNQEALIIDKHERVQMDSWKDVFDNLYSMVPNQIDECKDISGWNSSYTGESISNEEMSEWNEGTINRIKDLKPSKILEVGCGTGMILLNLIDSVQIYYGVDFSEVVINKLKEKVANDKVSLFCLKADELDKFEEEEFDVIILNSVIQYFPSHVYLERVLSNLAKLLVPNGYLFIGDVRNFQLLDIYHQSILFYKLPDSKNVGYLQKCIKSNFKNEEELVVDPRWFLKWLESINGNHEIKIELKRGRFINELTKFRYDVILQLDIDPQYKDVSILEINVNNSLVTIEQLLSQEKHEIIIFQNMNNFRLAKDLYIKDLIINTNNKGFTMSRMRELVKEKNELGFDPEKLWEMEKQFHYKITIVPSFSQKNYFNMICSRAKFSYKSLIYQYFFDGFPQMLTNK